MSKSNSEWERSLTPFEKRVENTFSLKIFISELYGNSLNEAFIDNLAIKVEETITKELRKDKDEI